MPLVLADRVRDTTTTTGTGTVTLSGTAPTGYQNFSVIGNGNTTYYTINAGSQWEVGIGTYSSTGPTLSRDTVLESSNGGALVNFSAGVKDVFVTYPADEVVIQDGATIAAGTAVLGVANGGTGLSSTPANGAIDIGNGTGFTRTTLTAGTNISITNGAGSITINATDQFVGTVTSVAASGGTTGMTFSGSPITTSGTLTLGGTLNVANGGTGVTTSTGTGSVVLNTSPTLVTPTLGAASATSIAAALGSVGAPSYTFTGDTNTGIYSPAADTLAFVEGGVEAMRLDASGRLLIGTTTGVGNDFVSIRFNSASSFPQGLNMVDSNASASGTNFQVFRRSDDTYLGNIRRNSTDNAIYVGGNSYLALGSGDTERMRIDSSGNVGIGTSSPGFRLDVSGTGRFTGLTQFDNDVTLNKATLNYLYFNDAMAFARNGVGERMRIDSSGNLGIGTSSPVSRLTASAVGGTVPTFTIPDATNNRYSVGLGSINVFGEGQRLDFYAGDSGANGTNLGSGALRMSLTAVGNFGIGTSSPSARLDVVGTSRYTFNVANSYTLLTSLNAAGSAFADAYTNALLHIWQTSGTERARITSDGSMQLSVGGVSNTHQFLYNESGAEIQLSDATGNGPILIDNSGGLARFYKVGSGAISMGTTGANIFQFITNGAERMRINSDGNVGIGTSSIASLLHVKLGSNAIEVYPSGTWATRVINAVDGTANNGLLVGNRWAATTSTVFEAGSIFGGGTGSWYSYYRIDGVGQSIWSNQGTERMRLDTSGNVGIGTSSPGGYRLNVNGTLFTASNVQFYSQDGFRFTSASAITAMRFGSSFTGESTAEWAYNRATGTTTLSVGNTGSALNERLRVDSSGNLAVGTSTTNARFRVAAGGSVNAPTLGTVSNYPAFFSNADTGYGFGIGTNSVDGHVWLQAQRSDSAVAYNLTLNEAGGNVGIGTSAPGVRLDVIGNATFGRGGGTFQGITLTNGDNSASAETVSFIDARNNLGTADGHMFFGHQTDGGSYITWATTAPGARNTDRRAERMRISANGGVAIGGTGTDATLHIQTSYGGYDRLTQMSPSAANKPALNIAASKSAGGSDQWWSWGVQTDNTWKIQVGVGFGGNGISIDASGNLTASGNVTAYSDARLKKDVETIDGALDLVSKMRGVRYTRIDTENRNVGVIAQEMLEVVPEVVQQGTGDDDTLSVAYGNLVGVLIEAIKELTARVAELEGK